MKLTAAQEKKVIEIYFANNKSPGATSRIFNTWAQHTNFDIRINKKNVIDAIKRFHRAPIKTHQNRQTLSKSEPVILNVVSSLFQLPGKSIRTCATENQLSVGLTHKIARIVLKLHPYRLAVVQSLSDYDKVVRFEACHRLLDVFKDDRVVIYSDEATFREDGHVNKWNYRVWEYERPDDFYVQQQQGARSVTVWAALSKYHLFGPYIFPSTVTGDAYRAILTEMFLPELLEKCGSLENVWFQQDGAPAHYANETLLLLGNIFQDRVVSRGLGHEWPPRSPDLTPCDFYLWGAVQDIVYRNGQFTSLSDLEDALINAFNLLRQEKMEDVMQAAQAVRGRLQKCIAKGGSQLIHS